MTILRKNATPGSAGQSIPGTPAVPGHAAYCQSTVIYHDSGLRMVVIDDPGNPATLRPPGYIIIWVTSGPWTETTPLMRRTRSTPSVFDQRTSKVVPVT